MASPLMQAHNLSKRFFREGRTQARYLDVVDDVSLTLESGSFSLLTGRSGCGKTTLLMMLAGLLEPSEGSVILEGNNLYELADDEASKLRNHAIGIVSQLAVGISSLSVIQNVALPALVYDLLDEQSALRRAHELLERLEIAELEDSWTKELSGGELRRMAIARALICSPRLIFADEPTADLDAQSTQLVLELLKEQSNHDCAVLVVSHDDDAQAFADIIYRMDAGKIFS